MGEPNLGSCVHSDTVSSLSRQGLRQLKIEKVDEHVRSLLLGYLRLEPSGPFWGSRANRNLRQIV